MTAPILRYMKRKLRMNGYNSDRNRAEAIWKQTNGNRLPPGKYYKGMTEDFEVYFSPVGATRHRRKRDNLEANNKSNGTEATNISGWFLCCLGS